MQTNAAAVATFCSLQEAAARPSPLATLNTAWADVLAGPVHGVTRSRTPSSPSREAALLEKRPLHMYTASATATAAAAPTFPPKP
jgi:hypothetical protein